MFLTLRSFPEDWYCLSRLEQYQKEKYCDLTECYSSLGVGTLANDV